MGVRSEIRCTRIGFNGWILWSRRWTVGFNKNSRELTKRITENNLRRPCTMEVAMMTGPSSYTDTPFVPESLISRDYKPNRLHDTRVTRNVKQNGTGCASGFTASSVLHSSNTRSYIFIYWTCFTLGVRTHATHPCLTCRKNCGLSKERHHKLEHWG